MDYAGVDAALLHVDRALGLDVAYLADCVRRYPGRLYSMTPVDEAAIGRRHGPGASQTWNEAIRVHGLHAIKFIPEYAYRAGQRTPGTTARSDRSGRLATSLGVPIFFTLGASPGIDDERDGFLAELGILQRWMERYPDATASVTHGFPYRAFLDGDRLVLPDAIWEPWQNPRLHLEVSFPVRLGRPVRLPVPRGLADPRGDAPASSARGNLLWGTDMPFQNRFCTYRQSRRWIETCGLLSTAELDDVMGGTTARLLGIAAAAAGRDRRADGRLVDGPRARPGPVGRRRLQGGPRRRDPARRRPPDLHRVPLRGAHPARRRPPDSGAARSARSSTSARPSSSTTRTSPRSRPCASRSSRRTASTARTRRCRSSCTRWTASRRSPTSCSAAHPRIAAPGRANGRTYAGRHAEDGRTGVLRRRDDRAVAELRLRHGDLPLHRARRVAGGPGPRRRWPGDRRARSTPSRLRRSPVARSRSGSRDLGADSRVAGAPTRRRTRCSRSSGPASSTSGPGSTSRSRIPSSGSPPGSRSAIAPGTGTWRGSSCGPMGRRTCAGSIRTPGQWEDRPARFGCRWFVR